MASPEEPTGRPDGERKLTAPSISLPKGGGAIHGMGEKFAANPVTGTGSMSVPLATSRGRSGFGPQLSLSYDSGAGNGPFGFGWSLSLPAITRKTDRGLPQYRDTEESDVYVLSGAEDLVPVLRPDGTRSADTATPGYVIHRYRPRIEGLFARIERWTDLVTGEIHWRSITGDNVTTLYGKDNTSRIVDPADPSPASPTRVFSWLICESYDDKGNAIVYEYAAENDDNVDQGQANERNRARSANRYLKRIRYGNRVPRLIEPDLTQASWLFEVVFDYDEGHYEDVGLDPDLPEAQQHRFARASASAGRSWAVRPDPFSSHRAGFEVRTYRRCRRVLMFHHIPDLATGEQGYDGLVRSTELDYADLDYTQPVAIEDELAHQGSTRFASFIRAVTQSGYVRDDTQGVVVRDGVEYATYLKKSLPPLELEYTKATIQDQVLKLDRPSLENLAAGLDGSTHEWVDLDGEGVSGVLTEQLGAWYYKPNLGGGRLGPLEAVAATPSLSGLGGGRQQLLDLAGDGQLDLVALAGPTPGFFERTQDRRWESFRAFQELPNLSWDEPNLRFVDLSGDGHADVLITEQDVFTWHQSLAEEGFGQARSVRQPLEEERGPRLVLADGTQSVYLADMCGDGLTDLVRVRNGEVCYWPNLGYGRFGAKVTMDNAPWFDAPDVFNQRRIRLADIDGSGTNDIIYLGHDGAQVYFNQSGNRLSDSRRLAAFPPVDDVSSVLTADLLGNGTACLVWSSPLPAEAHQPLRYIDLMGGTKPHLLTRSINNLGAETQVHYAPSTRFYMADKREGRIWVTRLPFPVHVVERVVTSDRISGNRFATRYAYHHGYFDGVEREFRGFGLVEQWDTEELAALNAGGGAPAGTNVDAASHVPPVQTRTWFHTGVYPGREPGLSDAQARARLLEDTVLPDGLSVDEEREAVRALKGSMLRQEIYALDGTDAARHPYTVTEQNFAVRALQPKGGNRHGVFFAHPREAVSYHYERAPADPRVGHQLTLEVDQYGNVLRSAAVAYGRRRPDPALSPADQAKQRRTLVTYTENQVTNPIDAGDDHRTPLPCESRTYELTGLPPPPPGARFDADQVSDAARAAIETDYASEPSDGLLRKRLIEHVRTRYRRDDLTGPLPPCVLQARALPFESYQLALTPDLVAKVYGARATDAMLGDEARYVHSDGDSNWWIPSGTVFYSPDPADTPAEELAYARRHFFLPHRYRDPFHTDVVRTESVVAYDGHDLLVRETRDALGNQVTVGERERVLSGTVLPARDGNDYRVLQPALAMDPNRNRSAVAFDALGMVVGTAVMGKPEDVPVPGDRIAATFRADLTQEQIHEFLTDPKGPPATRLLDDATTRIVYDLTAYRRSAGSASRSPAVAVTLARETHASDPAPADGLKIQVAFSYSDGLGREIQKKLQAEPGPVPVRDASGKVIVDADGQPQMTPDDVSPRWVGSGWTVFNNKGKPVRQYEPFFTDTHRFEFDVRIGVSPVVCYDPLGRVVATLHPNHTWEKVVFDAWREEHWDVNDTVALDPAHDDVAGPFVRRLPDSDYLPTWHVQRSTGGLGPGERDAAVKTTVHAGTQSLRHADALGRMFLTIALNRFERNGALVEEPYPTRIVFDIEGNQREVHDANDRLVMRYDYDVLGTPVHEASMEAGERWMLHDVAGQPVYAWDSRGFLRRFTYDMLRRPTETFVTENGVERLDARTVYGEGQDAAKNHRAHVFQLFDGAGVITSQAYDFKGNLLRSLRELLPDYEHAVNWKQNPIPSDGTFTSSMTYDALNRPTTLTAPDNSSSHLSYSEAGLLDRLDVNLRGATAPTPFVTNINYDAKGQRELISYGNGAQTRYEYDRRTVRLTRLQTTRPAGLNGLASQLFTDPAVVQDLRYTYDPVGNITRIEDAALQTIFHNNEHVQPVCAYTYDAIYRLMGVQGREHIGQTAFDFDPPDGDRCDFPFVGLRAHPNDLQAMRNYTEAYAYDAVGNFQSMRHTANGDGWTRSYEYDAASLIEPAKQSNRLTRTTVSGFIETYAYTDEHGNDVDGCMTAINNLKLVWDDKDQLQQVDLGGGGAAYCVYDATGQRVRKVIKTQNGTRKQERIYVGGFEVYREYTGNGATVTLERETLHVMDDKQRIALIETTNTQGNDGAPAQLIRYQLGNHLSSASLELDAQAQVISYEEFFPYGSTAYQAVRSQTETPKRYRYTGKERDEETGFTYHGARYYAAWLGRWTSTDRIGIAGGKNLYTYSNDNPCVWVDDDGKAPRKQGPSPGRAGSPQRMGDLMHYYSLARLAIRAQKSGLDVDTTGMSLTGFEIPTLPGGSRGGKDVGTVDLVIKSDGIYHLYDLKKKGTSRDWVNKYIKFFPPVGQGESVQRGTILENYPEVLAPIFYFDPRDPLSIHAISFNLPTDKTGAIKSGVIEYEHTRLDAKRLTEREQKAFVESKGFEWAPEKFRILNPSEDLDLIWGDKSLSPEGRLIYPELGEPMDRAWREWSDTLERREFARKLDWEFQQRVWSNTKMMMDTLTGAVIHNQLPQSGGFNSVAPKGARLTRTIPLQGLRFAYP